ncbi:MAG: hypothetical protein IJO57_04355 [Bacilli bacterium]|nr:hypothetical protein [Bacilli bacterium]
MNTKKLIGMVIGIILFAALIAGATFAWLSFTANITNANLTGSSRNFTFTYAQGTAISELLPLTQTPARNAITSGKGYITVSATKTANTPRASSFKLILNITETEIGVPGLIRFAVCRHATASNCNNSVATAIPASGSTTGNFVAVGTVNNTTGTQILYNDTATFTNAGAATGHYYIYFWIDASVINEDNLASAEGKKFAGHIYAEATQGE